MYAVCIVLWALLCWLGGWCGVESAERPAGIVPRCCPRAKSLAPQSLHVDELRAAEVATACQPDERTWTPHVFVPARYAFLERGIIPHNWRVEYSLVPECAELRVLRENASTYVLLAPNGRLQVRGGPTPLPSERFCVDADVALACAEDVGGSVVAKCCAAGHALSAGHCAADEARAADTIRELRELANGSAVRAGLPTCAEGSQYEVMGALGAAHVQVDGALAMGAAWIKAGAWCAETVDTVAGARVLACAEAISYSSVPKCCAAGHALTEGRCAADEARVADTMRELRELANGRAIRVGWPACAEGSQYAVAGALGAAQLQADGALAMGAARLGAGTWCADAVETKAGAHVLVCDTRARGASAACHTAYGARLAVGTAFLTATLAAGFALH